MTAPNHLESKIKKIEVTLYDIKKSVKNLFLNLIDKIEVMESELRLIKSEESKCQNTIRTQKVKLHPKQMKIISENTINTTGSDYEASVDDSEILSIFDSISSSNSPEKRTIPDLIFTSLPAGKEYNTTLFLNKFKKMFKHEWFTPVSSRDTLYSPRISHLKAIGLKCWILWKDTTCS